jgi:DinB family protein
VSGEAPSRAELLSEIADFPARLEAGAIGAAASSHPAAGEWGVTEHVLHLLAVESVVWQARLAQVAAEDDPQWSWTEPGHAPGFDGAPLSSILAAYAEARATTLSHVGLLDDAGWARFGTHATYGRLDVAGLLRLAFDHDEDHLAAIRALGV